LKTTLCLVGQAKKVAETQLICLLWLANATSFSIPNFFLIPKCGRSVNVSQQSLLLKFVNYFAH